MSYASLSSQLKASLPYATIIGCSFFGLSSCDKKEKEALQYQVDSLRVELEESHRISKQALEEKNEMSLSLENNLKSLLAAKAPSVAYKNNLEMKEQISTQSEKLESL